MSDLKRPLIQDALNAVMSKLDEEFGTSHGLIVPSSTAERRTFGWLFFPESQSEDPVFGVGPVIYDSRNGDVVFLSTAGEPEDEVAYFEDLWLKKNKLGG